MGCRSVTEIVNDAPKHFSTSVREKGVVGSSATRVEDLRFGRKFGIRPRPSNRTALHATTPQRQRSRHAPRSRQRRSKTANLEQTERLPLPISGCFPPLPVSQHTKVPKPAAAPAPYGGVLMLALPTAPLSATFSAVVALKCGRVRALVPRRLIVLFAANSKERRPSLRKSKYTLQVIMRTWQKADKMNWQRNQLANEKIKGGDNTRIKRYITKYTINPALSHHRLHRGGQAEGSGAMDSSAAFAGLQCYGLQRRRRC